METPFASLVDLVEEIVQRGIPRYTPRTERADAAVYLRPATTAAQKDFVPLTAANVHTSIATAQANHGRRKKQIGPFVYDLFVFVVKEQIVRTGIRRATRSCVLAAANAVEEFLQARPDVQLGEIARTHLVLTHARQPEDTTVTLPDSATFRQMQHIDTMQNSEPGRESAEDPYKTINVKINGLSELLLTMDVRELRVALGLPNYNFLARGIFSSFVPPPPPAEDIEDVDHLSDGE
ncbi:hypothetical protein ATCC90586_011032 [Pythium insidiosum]|nr:hypothetical protein ATCC90586_011032 [Pythium insidiosum]